jgi:16S rRNA C967 or C1407 C5-methylase (RsmB/RsmF family)
VLRAENAVVVGQFLQEHGVPENARQGTGQARDITQHVLAALGIEAVAPSNEGPGHAIAPGTGLSNGVTTRPGSGGMDGFYYACLEKTP